MAEVAPAPAPVVAAPAKAPKKKAAPKPKNTGPSVGELIVNTVSASKERSGMSLAALKKALSSRGYDVEKNNSRVKVAVKGLVTKGTLVQTKGTGASGSFKLNKNAAEAKAKKPAKKAAAPKTKKPVAAKKPKKAVAKKPAVTKKSPKKTKKPAAAKKVAKSPKKTAKSPKKVTKPAAAKKSPARKVAKPKKSAPKRK